MLGPEYLRDLPEAILALFGKVELRILADMARRLKKYNYWLPSVEHQNERLRIAGIVQEDVLKALSELSGKSEQELRQLMQTAAKKTLKSDTAVYEAAGKTVPKVAESEHLRELLNAGYQATAQTMRNVCRTTARTAAKQFTDALDLAWLQVSSGAFDLNIAVRTAIEDLAEQGIQAIRYPSGRADTLEVAVRRAVVTGVNQTSLKLQMALAEDVGCDLVEVSAHSGARPSHAEWQGRVYSISGKHQKYPSLVAVTGYGSGEGLGGWNCRHTFGPYIEGAPTVWTEEELQKLNEPKYEYNGKMLTEYEAQQKQRYHERQIRRWKREEAALNAAGLDSTAASAKVKQWQSTQAAFLKQTGLQRQYERENIVDFGKSIAKSVGRGIMETGSDSVTISSIEKPIEQRNSARGKPSAITHYDVELNTRQQRLLDALPSYNSRATVNKRAVSMSDLAALTAKTGDEFALFTRKNQRLIVRGNYYKVDIQREEAAALNAKGYVWSGHTHPGADRNCLIASDGDFKILALFDQSRSTIFNSVGQHLEFYKKE